MLISLIILPPALSTQQQHQLQHQKQKADGVEPALVSMPEHCVFFRRLIKQYSPAQLSFFAVGRRRSQQNTHNFAPAPNPSSSFPTFELVNPLHNAICRLDIYMMTRRRGLLENEMTNRPDH